VRSHLPLLQLPPQFQVGHLTHRLDPKVLSFAWKAHHFDFQEPNFHTHNSPLQSQARTVNYRFRLLKPHFELSTQYWMLRVTHFLRTKLNFLRSNSRWSQQAH
jgi:hypothetical protein